MIRPRNVALRVTSLLGVTFARATFAQAPLATEHSAAAPTQYATAGATVFSVESKPDPADPAGERTITATSFEWQRPLNVQWALISGCGGGGSGAIGNQLSTRFSFGGGGGGGASIETMLIGPLTADRYTISIGQGGTATRLDIQNPPRRVGPDAPPLYSVPGAPGEDTTFTGEDFAVTFRGAPGGNPVEGGNNQFPPARAAPPSGPGGIAGGRSNGSGDASAFAAGGVSSRRPTSGGGGGGGGGTGPGGIGGGPNANGGDGRGSCSGGGGSGPVGVRGDRYIESGSGAHGFLALVPIVNLDATQAQLDAILARLLLLENAGAPPRP
jgi:hypothetical protein